jgi:hypothetical protein
MAATLEQAKAAKQAAQRAYALMLEMLEKNQGGEVCIRVTPAGLQPFKRIEKQESFIKVARGGGSDIG